MRKRGNHILRLMVLASLGFGFSSCSGGSSGLPDLEVVAFNFSPTLAGVRINAPLEITFSAPVDGTSVTPDNIRIFTTTTTQEQQEPGAPAIGQFITSGNIVRFLPRIPQNPDLSDAGLRIGFRYAIQVPAAPDIVAPVLTTDGDPMVVPFSEEFTTLNSTILSAPGDITAEANLTRLSEFFIDEGIELGEDPCPRADLPEADRDSPQVIFTDPAEGESGFGRITGIQPGLGTAFVRLDPITLLFSEPIGPWRVRLDDITVRNVNLDGETFDLSIFFQQDRGECRLLITVFDRDSAFDQASVPQGRYTLTLTNFSDLAGNPLVNSNTCTADGTFQLSFSTVSSPTLPTDFTVTFDDDDNDANNLVDVGGLATSQSNANIFTDFGPPFLGGMATDTVDAPSPSGVTSSANWGDVGYWTGCEVLWDNGFNADAPNEFRPIPAVLRLRGGSVGAGTAVLAPIAGRATGPSDGINGSIDGQVPVLGDPLDQGKFDFVLDGDQEAELFTGDALTGPIVYNYRRFTMTQSGADRPVLTYRNGSLFPLMIFVEDEITIDGGIIDCDGRDGQLGFNGNNDATLPPLSRNPGGIGGRAGPGGGHGGNGGAFTLGNDVTLLNGLNGQVPANIFGALDQLSEAGAGIGGMATGGGGHYDFDSAPADPDDDEPVYQGGGGAGQASPGTAGFDNAGDITLPSGQGVGGKVYGSGVDFSDTEILAAGGAGGGGGGAEDDGGGAGGGDPNGQSDQTDDGGGGGGGAGGFIGLYCGGNITLGSFSDITDNTTFQFATIRAVGGRGGSTYDQFTGDPPLPGDTPGDEDVSAAIGEGEAGGGGGGGGICIISGGQLLVNAAEMYVFGKQGGNSELLEGGSTRGIGTKGGDGGGGVMVISDIDAFNPIELPAQLGGSNPRWLIGPDPFRDTDQDGEPDLGDPNDPTNPNRPIILDLAGMTPLTIPNIFVSFDIYGDDPRERLFDTSQIVTEFFDTVSDSTTYDNARVLSNAPRFNYEADPINNPDPTQRTIRVFVDTADSDGGLPNLSSEDAATGTLSPPTGGTEEIGLHFDRDTGDELSTPQFESRVILPVSSSLQFRRFLRARILFNLAADGSTPDDLLSSFAPPGAADLPVADDPLTPGPDNNSGNTDTAPEGVPAVAELRITFTVGG